MTDSKRILELALRGLESERQRIDDEMAEIQKQLGARGGTVSASMQRPGQTKSQSGGNLTPAGRKKLSELMKRRWAEKRRAAGASSGQASKPATKSSSGGNLTAAGRKKLSDLMKKRWADRRKAAAKAAR